MTTKNPLGQATSYPDRYSPDLLYAIARTDSREALGLDVDLPFYGVDIWNAWELTWLDDNGLPQVAVAEFEAPAVSPNIIESKSLKLYLGSFAMSRFSAMADVADAIQNDLSACIGLEVAVKLFAGSDVKPIENFPGHCIDGIDVTCDQYDVDASLLSVADEIVEEALHSHLLRSLCPVTNQPDIGSLLVSYRGPRIDREGLLRYIVSYRQHNDFHEACVERMLLDITAHCQPEQLSVCAHFQRRGGIDINPYRSSLDEEPPNIRLWRQ
jgi:7-cyano-7-deazaguanine reductase